MTIPHMDETPDTRLRNILEAALAAKAPGREDCRYLLGFETHSIEAGVLRATANAVTRRRFGNAGLMLGQIGVHMAPCDGGCAFCAFAKPHTTIQESTLSMEESIQRAQAFSQGGVAGIFIMTMHRFGFDWFLDYVSQMRRHIPAQTQLLANVGDMSVEQLGALKAAGMTGAYHVVRLGEGRDTHLSPSQRLRTIERIGETGLDWYNSCEPIGPEHTPEEIPHETDEPKEGFSSALWRRSQEITTADCRNMLAETGFDGVAIAPGENRTLADFRS